MPLPITITVTVQSTPSLRGNYIGTKRRPERTLSSNDICGSKNQPLVVVRGCSAIQLQAATNAQAQINWSLKACGQPSVNLQSVKGPALSSSTGKVNSLTTDAVGDYCVTASYTDPSSHQEIQSAIYLRFVGAQVTFTESSSNPLRCSCRSLTQAGFEAGFEFKADVKLFGGGQDGMGGVDSVQIKVIQNLMGALRGVYRQGQSEEKGKSGKLTEGYHQAGPPYIDCGDEEEIPFYNSAPVTNPTAPVRKIEFWDGPGLTIAPFFDPSTKEAVEEGERSDSTYTLIGTEGENQFVAAVVAYSKHLKHTYVVLAKMHWKLNVTSSAVQVKGFKCTCTPQSGSGTSKVKEEILSLPLEASAAGIETYGPTAVSGGEDSDNEDETDYSKYQWQQT